MSIRIEPANRQARWSVISFRSSVGKRRLRALILTGLLIGSLLAAHADGGIRAIGDWFPTPDGYVWPQPMKEAPAFKPTSTKPDDLPASLRKFWIYHAGDEGNPSTVEVFYVDLNGDKRDEAFVEIHYAGGSGGTFYEILTPEGDGYRSVGNLQGWDLRFHQPKNGWYQIEVMSKSGGGEYTRYLLAFDGKEYVTARNEGHNFHTGKVEIRATGRTD